MVRHRKHDSGKQKHGVSLGSKAKQEPPRSLPSSGADQPTAADMHYVSNSRSKARASHFKVSPSGLLRWVVRMPIIRLFLVIVVVGCFGIAVGRYIHHHHGMHHNSPSHSQSQDTVKNVQKAHQLAAQQAARQQTAKLRAAQHHAAKGLHVLQNDAQQHDSSHQQAPHLQAAQQWAAPQHNSAQQNGAQQQAARQHSAAATVPKPNEVQQSNAQQHVAQPPAAQPVLVPQPAAEPAAMNQHASSNRGNQPPVVPLQQAVPKQAPGEVPRKPPPIQDLPSDLAEYPYHILQTLTNTAKMPHLKTRFIECTKSILDKASINLHFFFVVDEESRKFVENALQDITDQHIAKMKFQFHFIAIDDLAHQLAPMVSILQEHVTGGHPYYQDAIFFLSIAIHRGVLPSYVRRVIMLDTDLKFMTDVKELFDRFNLFTGDNIMGVAHEMQPVYRHLLSLYRNYNPGTKVGDPPPDGLTGFNSGVLLLDLERMTRSVAYRGFVNAQKVKELSAKYYFKGHLGDQDFFTLISLEKPDLFHVLPCSWNRQLCTWWRNKGYVAVFDQYFTCNERINIYHGNCNTQITV